MAAPNTSQRQECYVARDAFYQCMVRQNEQVEACKAQEQKYHSKCLKSWVSLIFWAKNIILHVCECLLVINIFVAGKIL